MQINSETIEYFVRNRKRWNEAYFGTGNVSRTPAYAQLHEYAMVHSPLTGEEFYTDGETLVHWEARTAHELRLDIPDITFDCYNIEVEALGGEVRYFDDKAPGLINPPVEKKSELLQLEPPDPYRDGRMPFVFEIIEEYENVFGCFPRLNVTAPFTLAAKLRGVQNFLMDIVRDSRFVKDLLSFVTEEVLEPYIDAIRASREHEGEIIAADAIASPPNLDLDLLEELALKPLLELKKSCGDDVVILNWWGESHVKVPDRLMELKIRASSGNVLEGQDPDVNEIGPEGFRDFALSHDSSLILGVGTDIMMMGDPASVRERVERYIKVGEEMKGNFLLYFTNLVGDTPLENIRAAIGALNGSDN